MTRRFPMPYAVAVAATAALIVTAPIAASANWQAGTESTVQVDTAPFAMANGYGPDGYEIPLDGGGTMGATATFEFTFSPVAGAPVWQAATARLEVTDATIPTLVYSVSTAATLGATCDGLDYTPALSIGGTDVDLPQAGGGDTVRLCVRIETTAMTLTFGNSRIELAASAAAELGTWTTTSETSYGTVQPMNGLVVS